MKNGNLRKSIPVLLHIAAWILLFSLPYLLRPSSYEEAKHPAETDSSMNFLIARLTDLLLIVFFYVNAYFFIPRFFYKKKNVFYLVSVLLSFSAFSVITFLLNKNFVHKESYFTFRLHLMFCVFVFAFILACSIAFKTIRDKIISDGFIKEKENEHLKTELSLLRSQVSPHFMFNVLNNMVALARKKSDLLEPSLIKLSSLMRYMLYETGDQKVSLEKEMEYLQSYIDLQQQRFGKKVVIDVNMLAPDKQYEIEPMLLIPFVENAFKHGTGMIQDARLSISLSAINNELIFSVSNEFAPDNTEIKDASSGIGLPNVQRRLELLYAEKHTLNIVKSEHTFTVNLKIQLN